MTLIRGTHPKQLLVFEQEVVCVVQTLTEKIEHSLTFTDGMRDWADISGEYHLPRLGIPSPYCRREGYNYYGYYYFYNEQITSLVKYNNEQLYYREGVWDPNQNTQNYVYCHKLYLIGQNTIFTSFKLQKGDYSYTPTGFETVVLPLPCTAQQVQDALNDASGGNDYECIGGPTLTYDTPIFIKTIGRYGVYDDDRIYIKAGAVSTEYPYDVGCNGRIMPQNAVQELYHNIPPTSGSFTLSNGSFVTDALDYDAEAQDIEDALNDAVLLFNPTYEPGPHYKCTGGPLDEESVFVESVGKFSATGVLAIVGGMKLAINFPSQNNWTGPYAEPDEGVLPGDVQIRFKQIQVISYETGVNLPVDPPGSRSKSMYDHLNVKIFSTYLNWFKELNDLHEWGYDIQFYKVNALGIKVLNDYGKTPPFEANYYPITYFEYFRQVRELIKKISLEQHGVDYTRNWFWCGNTGSINSGWQESVSSGFIGRTGYDPQHAYFTIKDWDFSPKEIEDIGKYGKYAFKDFLSLLPVQIVNGRVPSTWLYTQYSGFGGGSDSGGGSGDRYDTYPIYGLSRYREYTLYKPFYEDQVYSSYLDCSNINYANYEYFKLDYYYGAFGNQVATYVPIAELSLDYLLAHVGAHFVGTLTGTDVNQKYIFDFYQPSDTAYLGWITFYPPGDIVNGVETGQSWFRVGANMQREYGSYSGPAGVKYGMPASSGFPDETMVNGQWTTVRMGLMIGRRGQLGLGYPPNDPVFRYSSSRVSNYTTSLPASDVGAMLDELLGGNHEVTLGKHYGTDPDSLTPPSIYTQSYWIDDEPYLTIPTWFNGTFQLPEFKSYPFLGVASGYGWNQYAARIFTPQKQNVNDITIPEIVTDSNLSREFTSNMSWPMPWYRFDITGSDLSGAYNSDPNGFYYSNTSYLKGKVVELKYAYIIDTKGKSLRQYLGLKFKETNMKFSTYNYQTDQQNGYWGTITANTGFTVAYDVTGRVKLSFGWTDGYLRGYARNTDNEHALADVIFEDGTDVFVYECDKDSINKVVDISIPAEIMNADPQGNLFYFKIEPIFDSAPNDSIEHIKEFGGITHLMYPNFAAFNGLRPSFGQNANITDWDVSKLLLGPMMFTTENNMYNALGAP